MLSLRLRRLVRYQHQWLDGTFVEPQMRTASKVLCVARNYTDNVAERNDPIGDRMANAAIFLKPPSSLVSMNSTIGLGGYSDVVCETEMAVLIGQELMRNSRGCSSDEAKKAISGITVAFDFTRKDLQNKLKAAGKPWELAKAFDGACPIAPFVPIEQVGNLVNQSDSTRVELELNRDLVLSQCVNEMILPPLELIQLLTKHFTLCPGDVILTGTPTLPQQPPRLKGGDQVVARVGNHVEIRSKVNDF